MSKLLLRIHSLDYLRGLAALGIMFYHMHLLNFGKTDASSPLAVIKIYFMGLAKHFKKPVAKATMLIK
ncbi:hypothetical protein [Dyadobacter psychrophilus]|uniref:Uncharacterized protein n=1 Tax=Dyadobacter psychrophilus TaxID=651661 RepID=A0A1T5DLC6_9BACT|nr:hypothetical protein [Dyadobacter psychrophilus]SKB72499.1 hypothetical protein SAMN05660293_01718 [Dyadobacter psychrophilus]